MALPLVHRAERIRSLVSVACGRIIEIDRELIAAKSEICHGRWYPWLDAEFGWSVDTARNYMRVAHAFQFEALQIPNDSGSGDLAIDATTLYTLAATDVPADVRAEAVERAQASEYIIKEEADKMIARRGPRSSGRWWGRRINSRRRMGWQFQTLDFVFACRPSLARPWYRHVRCHRSRSHRDPHRL